MDGSARQFLVSESGATAIEYALIASLVSVAIIGALLALNESVIEMYRYIGNNLMPVLGGDS